MNHATYGNLPLQASATRRPHALARWCLAIALVLNSALLLASCGDPARTGTKPPPAFSAQNPATVVATTGMIADLAQRIGADRARVQTLMGPGVDPHLYKATPGDIRALTDAHLILYNGLLLEGRMTDLLVRLNSGRSVVAVTERITEDRLLHPEGEHAHPDPHVWFDVSLWILAAERIRDAFVALDPPGQSDYESRAATLIQELSALDAEVRLAIAAIPEERRLLVTAHDAFGYFGHAYDIEVRGIQGISTESEASLRDINSLVDDLVARKVPAVFVETSVPRKTVEALVEGARSRSHTLRIGGELFSDAMGAQRTPEGTYAGMVRHNVRTIVEALR